jgi:hypothetical protein
MTEILNTNTSVSAKKEKINIEDFKKIDLR